MGRVNVLRSLRIGEGSVVDEGANPHAVICLTKRRVTNVDELAKLKADLAKAAKDLEVTNADLAKVKADLKTSQDELAKAKAPAPKPEDVEKGLPDSIKAELKKAREDREALAKKLDEEIAKRETGEWIAKVKGYGAAGVDAGELAPVLRKAVAHLSEAEVATLEKAFRAHGELSKKISKLTEQVGKSGAGPEGSDAEAKLEKRIGEIRKASPELTYSQAYTKALESDPSTYEALNGQEA